jgi:hypothetical protein
LTIFNTAKCNHRIESINNLDKPTQQIFEDRSNSINQEEEEEEEEVKTKKI